MYVCISLLLLNVQASTEHPFDAESVDDIFFELPDELWEIATAAPATDAFAGSAFDGGAALFGPAAAEARALEVEMARLAKEAAAARRRDE